MPFYIIVDLFFFLLLLVFYVGTNSKQNILCNENVI